MRDYAVEVRQLLTTYSSRERAVGACRMALANILAIPGDERRRGFKHTVGGNGAAAATLALEFGGSGRYLASEPDDVDDRLKTTEIGQLIYHVRKTGDQARLFMVVAGVKDEDWRRQEIENLRHRMDPGGIGVEAALAIVERVTGRWT